LLPARYLDESHRKGRRGPARSPAARPRPAAKPLNRAVYLAALALAVLVALTVSFRHAAITRLGYEAGRLEVELAALVRENGERETAVASLASPARIQELAAERLGMVAPGPGLLVVAAEPQAEAGAAISSGSLQQPREAESPGVLGRIWRLVRRLAGVPAEAAAVPGP